MSDLSIAILLGTIAVLGLVYMHPASEKQTNPNDWFKPGTHEYWEDYRKNMDDMG